MFNYTTKSIGRRIGTAIMFICGFVAHSAHADFINTDFSSGFDNWQGDVNYTGGGDIFAVYPNNFSLTGSTATLTTTAAPPEDYWSIVMYQDSTLSGLAANESLLVSLIVDSFLTSVDDFFFVQLRDLTTNDVIDLSAGGTFDISAMAGNSVAFEFGVEDVDFALGDSLTVSDISFTTVAENVSAPAGSFFFALGLGLLAWRKVRA